jgi:ATP-dependent 26S proteasome regulatory subunit
MDPLIYMMLSKSSGYILADILLVLLAMPLLSIFSDKIKENLDRWIGAIFQRSGKKTIEFVGWELICSPESSVNYNYPAIMKAICHALMAENKLTQAQHLPPNHRERDSYRSDFVVSASQSFDLNPEIRVEIKRQKETAPKSQDISYKITLSLIAKKDIKKVEAFVKEAVAKYKRHMTTVNAGKIYHFIFQGQEERYDRRFKMSLLSDTSQADTTNYETFDSLIGPHTEQLKKDISLLKNIDYYRRSGAKHKKGYLFYGPPGCGKTASVIAMANYDKRHIIEIPMSRVKTNADIEEILNLTEIEGISFRKDQIIVLFDEIDSGLEQNLVPDATPKKTPEEEETELHRATSYQEYKRAYSRQMRDRELQEDQITLGSILSRLDGVGSYNGMIIIATTNHINKLPEQMYRHGRLNPVFFDYLSLAHTQKMIEEFYACKLTEEQKIKLPSSSYKLAPSALRQYIEQHLDDLAGLLVFLEALSDPIPQWQPPTLTLGDSNKRESLTSLAVSSPSTSQTQPEE